MIHTTIFFSARSAIVAVLGWGGLTIVAAAAVAKDAPAHLPPAFETGYKTDDGRIQGRWKGTCEIFQTPTGPIPCAGIDPEFIVGSYGDDGMSFNFWSAEGYPERSIYLNGDSWTDYHLSRLPRGVSRVLVVNDRIIRESPAWAKGFCSISRDGHDVRCKADLDSTNDLGGHYEVVFRNITPSPYLTAAPAEPRGSEVTQWETTCEDFETPSGPVPCDLVNNGFGITTKAPNVQDGTASFGFAYDDPHEPNGSSLRVLFFKTRIPEVPGVYPIEEVQQELDPGIKTHGVCDLRGGYLQCNADVPSGRYFIRYRLVSQTHISCPPASTEAGELGEPEDKCVTVKDDKVP